MFDWLRGDTVDRTGGDGLNTRPEGEQHLALYKFDSCPFCRRVFNTIDGLDVNIEYRDTRSDVKWRRDLMKRTGRSQVPCLLIDGEPLFESTDISRFLSQHYAAKR